MGRLEADAEARFFASLEHAGRFFMGTSDVHAALERLVAVLDEASIPYAIAGALALGEYGYRRTTDDVDVLLTAEGLERFKAAHLGRGYVEKFPGSRGVRDTVTNVGIDVLLAGDFPGDGKPKPIQFPDPAAIAVRGSRVALVPLTTLIELKLASGMTAPHRLRDLADVLELIRRADLSEALAEELDPFVVDKYRELWRAAQVADGER